jgi:hypothetical protein
MIRYYEKSVVILGMETNMMGQNPSSIFTITFLYGNEIEIRKAGHGTKTGFTENKKTDQFKRRHVNRLFFSGPFFERFSQLYFW